MKQLTQLSERVRHIVWGQRLQDLPFWKAYPARWARLVWLLVRDLTDGQLSMRAMSLVYTTLLSMVPLLALSFSVLKAFGVHNQIEPVLLNFLSPLGPKSAEVTATVVSFVDNMRVGVLGAVGLGLLFYTVVSLIQKVERAFNNIWRVSRERPLVARFSDYLSVLLIGPVLVFSAIGATASLMSTALVRQMTQFPVLGWMIETAGTLVPYFFVIAAFTFVYMFVPNTRVRFSSAFIGAVVAGALWQTIGWGFASFVVNSTKYDAIYSGFAILILFMIWLYLTWLILLVGSSIAFYYQHPEYLSLDRTQTPCPGNHAREWIGLLTICLIAKHHFDGATAPSVETIASRLGVARDRVEDVLVLLQLKGLVVPLNSVPESYMPQRALERISVQSVLDALRRADEQPPSAELRPTLEKSVAEVFSAVEQATARTLDGLSIRDLILGINSPREHQSGDISSSFVGSFDTPSSSDLGNDRSRD